MKEIFIRVLLVLLVTIGTFTAQGLTVVGPNEVEILTYRTLQGYNTEVGYITEPGVYLVDPFMERMSFKMGIKWPTTLDYLKAALYADAMRDMYYELEGSHNPKNEAEILQMVEDIIPYINAYEKAIGRPVAVDEVKFFWPEKGSGRYDLPIAYYCYLERSITINMSFFREYMRGEDSFLATLIHEMNHSALNFGTGEILCQLLTLQVLYDMAEGGYPGANFAFWDELRSWFLCAAKYRVYYNHGWRAVNLGMARHIGYTLRWYHEEEDEHLPMSWMTYDFDNALPSIPHTLWWFFTGHSKLLDFEPLFTDPFVKFTQAFVQWKYNLRVNGIHIRPAHILHKLGVSYQALRQLFGPNYWHIDWVLKPGERDYLKVYIEAIYQGEHTHKAEFERKMRDDPEHFAPIWWEYLYGPLQIIEAKAAGVPCLYLTWAMDINDILEGGDMMIFFVFYFGFGAQVSEMEFEDVGPVVWKLLNLKLMPQTSAEDGYDKIVPFVFDEPPEEPRVNVFPVLSLVTIVLVIVEWQVRKKSWWAKVKAFAWHYFINLCISIDQFFNTLFFGDPDETMSSRLGKFKGKVKLYRIICWLLDKIDPGHCQDSIEEDEGKDQLTPFGEQQ